jgi:hypothetical protein
MTEEQNAAIAEALTSLEARAELLEAELRGALCMLDEVNPFLMFHKRTDSLRFVADREDLNETFKRLTTGELK